MAPKSNLPRIWLTTDEKRLADPLPVLRRLPRGSGVLFRDYGRKDRAVLAEKAVRICRRRGLVFLVGGDWRLAARVGADGLHLPEGMAARRCLAPALGWIRRTGKRLTLAAHSPGALARAAMLGADATFLSPIFATESHPGAKPIGPWRASAWCRPVPIPVFALGGMNPKRKRRLAGFAGFAAIDFLKSGR